MADGHGVDSEIHALCTILYDEDAVHRSCRLVECSPKQTALLNIAQPCRANRRYQKRGAGQRRTYSGPHGHSDLAQGKGHHRG